MGSYYCEAFSEWLKESSPEKALLAAILERAYRDLGFSMHGEDQSLRTAIHVYRRTAVTWFRSENTVEDCYYSFSFKQIKEELALSIIQLEFLESRVVQAEKLLAREAHEAKVQQAYFIKRPPVKKRCERKVA